MAAEVKTFDFELPTRIRFGAGVVKSVGEEARSLGEEHILIITDPGIVKAGIVDRILEDLKEEVYEKTEIFYWVEPNPRDTTVHKAY